MILLKLAPLNFKAITFASPMPVKKNLCNTSPSDIASAGALKKYVEEGCWKEKKLCGNALII